MFKTEFLDVIAMARNLPKLRAIANDSDLKMGETVRIYNKDFYRLKNQDTVEIICDVCGKCHTRTLYLLVEKQPNEEKHECDECRYTQAREKTKITIRNPEFRIKKSKEALSYFSSDVGKMSIKQRTIKRNLWLKTEEGIRHVEDASKQLPHKRGEEHPNWNPDKKGYLGYRQTVDRLTRNTDLSGLSNFDKPRGRCGVNGAYQLDHIIPVKYGYDNHIPPEIISNIFNLRFITWEENTTKRKNVDQKFLKLLLEKTEYTNIQETEKGKGK